jgi:2-dehydro-3-deoxyphosphogluconate aldolase / (4S)-4-hydroxy-2-oxoglutarate aldolase
MMSWLERAEQERVIAVIRTDDWERGWQMATAVAAGGIKSIEIAANSDRPWELIEKLQQALPDCSIGTGTILTLTDLENAIAANVAFMFAPHTNSSLIDRAVAAKIPIVPGALTPTEIVTAWQAGATAVKVFPIQSVGGSDYLRALQGPLGQIPLIPTGGVDLDNTIDLLNAGAIAVGMSSCLFPKQAIIDRNWQLISDRVKILVNKLTIDN